MEPLSSAIVKTLSYFDGFDRPLTGEETYRFLWHPLEGVEQISFLKTIDALAASRVIEKREGYFVLPGRSGLIDTHQARVWLVEKKMNIARRATQKMRWVPFVRAVFVCNTVAMGSPKAESDVDVFIVVRSGRLWLSRLFITLVLSAFRLRRTRTRVADRVCLSFYHTDDALSFLPLALFPDDVYLIYWIAQLMPLYDPSGVQKKIHEENAWILDAAPFSLGLSSIVSRRATSDTIANKPVKLFLEKVFSGWLGSRLERLAKKIQTWKMEKNVRSLQHEPDTRVVVSDKMLKFHENDRRAMYRERWKETIARYAKG